MTECKVVCGGGLGGGRKEVLAATGATHLEARPKFDDHRSFSKPFLPGFLGFAERSGVNDVAIVLVQVFCDMIHVPLFESFNHGLDYLNLRGIRVRHGTKRLEVEFLCGCVGSK